MLDQEVDNVYELAQKSNYPDTVDFLKIDNWLFQKTKELFYNEFK